MKIFKNKIVKMGAAVAAAAAALVTTVSANTAPDITTTLTTSFQTVVNDLLLIMAGVLPIALTIFGLSIGIAFAIKWFKKLIGS
jgi:TRAP-type mannitol/chloroaromatic compound transport system substrate-binding protein